MTHHSSLSPVARSAYFISGIFISAWGFRAFLMENEIITGGLGGLSLLVYRAFDIQPSITQWAISVVILSLAWIFVGKKAALSAIAGSALFPAAILASSFLPSAPCENSILAALFGGLIVGLGLGIVFKANGTMGGFSLIARILTHKFDISIPVGLLIIDGMLILATAALYGAEDAMLAMLSVLAVSKAVDLVQTGFGLAKSVTVITSQGADMKAMLLTKLDCGATKIQGEGAYSGEARCILICVVPRAKVSRLRRNVHYVDPQAFTIISDASEVLGYGFSSHG